METVRTEQLSKSFKGVFRLGPLDLRVAPGEILGIMGPNGAGKTTLLRLLWGFMRPDSGSISVFGMQPHLEQVKVRLRAGYMSENPQSYFALTGRQFLRFVGNFYEGWDGSRTDRLLEKFGVPSNLKIEKLSKGNRIKLAMVSAVGHRPALLMLDEPTSGLDPLARLEILHFLKSLAQEESVSILLSSHISDDLDLIADSVLMLNKGRVVEYAGASFLLGKYGQPRLEAVFVHAIGDQHHS
ncbi:MAG TPA: ABC transporter ATP-binding protein [Terriglobia bacterium]|nr:ABC transporter ATP-binding protein [Terriglobia bacterium]